MKALAVGAIVVVVTIMTYGQQSSTASSVQQPALDPPVRPTPTPQLLPSNKRMVEAWNELVASVDEENKALKEENDAFLELQASLKLHAPWLELDLTGKHRLNRAALIEQIIESHQKRAAAYNKRIALLRKLQQSDR